MPKTKWGLDQSEKPAPLWFRRLTNAVIMCFLPAYVGFINIMDMSDYRRSILAQIAVAVPFVMKGIGMVMGNGQVYSPTNETVDEITEKEKEEKKDL